MFEAITYLKKDLLSLYDVINKANRQFFLNYDVSITEALTISGLAYKIFMKNHYNNNIPLINNKQIYTDIKQSYYGGRTEVYIPRIKNIFCYDVNSLYPFVAKNPMPGLECSYIEYYDDNQYDLNDLFGVFFCEIYVSEDNYLGLLPVRDKKLGLIFPVGN
jgi:hypothetical protein